MTLARGEREWALLVSEYNICKKKLESKRQALKILMGDLEACQRERDIYKNKIKQLLQEVENYKKKELENDHKEIKGRKSPATSPSIRSPEHTKTKRERKFSGHSIWEQELQSVRDRKNKTLSQLLCEAREESKALKNDFMDLRVLYREAQEDIILLRENVARQRTNEKGSGKMEDLEARQDLIQHLERRQEKVEELEREVQAANDEKSDIINERDHYRDKVERLNTQLNFILGADERRLVDIDAILMENRYQKEQIKQLKEENRNANASLARQKAAIEKKKARLAKAGYHTGSGQSFMGAPGVKQTLPSLISDISSSFHHGVSSTTVNDLQSLANSLSESLSEKDIALLHQRNTNKILGNRVTELEKKLKTLEVSGLWSLEGHRGYGSEDILKLYIEKLKRSSSQDDSTDTIKPSDLPDETETASAESSPDLHNGEVFFGIDVPVTDHELIDVITPTISEEEDECCENNKEACESNVNACGVSACSLEKHARKGDSLTEGDFPTEGDSLNEGDSLTEGYSITERDSLTRGDSPSGGDNNFTGDSKQYGDWKINGDSNAKGDSPLHGNYIAKGDSPLCENNTEGDSLEISMSADVNGDYHSRGDSHVDSQSIIKDSLTSANSNKNMETFTLDSEGSTAPISNSTRDFIDNSTWSQNKAHSMKKSSEHSPLNKQEKCVKSRYGSLGNQPQQISIGDSEDNTDCYDSGGEAIGDTEESFYSPTVRE